MYLLPSGAWSKAVSKCGRSKGKSGITRWDLPRFSQTRFAFSPDDRYLACASEQCSIHLWDLTRRQVHRQLPAIVLKVDDLGHARQTLDDAVRLSHVSVNPWKHVRQRAGDPSERRAYVSVADVERVIDHWPNSLWRLMVGLSRFGGLRVPSEAFLPTWGDVDWARDRLRVPSAKTSVGKLKVCWSAMTSANGRIKGLRQLRTYAFGL